MRWCIFVLSLLSTIASTDNENESRSKRQFPFPFPPPPVGGVRQMFRERLRERMMSHFSKNPQSEVSNIRQRINSRISSLRNATQAAKGCFKNEHGYKCCSQQLFSFMGGAFKSPIVERLLSHVDLQKVVEKVIELVQRHFDTSFEVVIAPADFASKNTFRGDLMCKTKTPNGKTVLVYATPVPYSTEPGIFRRLTENEIKSRHWGANLLRVSELSFFANITRHSIH